MNKNEFWFQLLLVLIVTASVIKGDLNEFQLLLVLIVTATVFLIRVIKRIRQKKLERYCTRLQPHPSGAMKKRIFDLIYVQCADIDLDKVETLLEQGQIHAALTQLRQASKEFLDKLEAHQQSPSMSGNYADYYVEDFDAMEDEESMIFNRLRQNWRNVLAHLEGRELEKAEICRNELARRNPRLLQ